MKDREIRWRHVNPVLRGRRLFEKYCHLNGCCEECNKKVRFWCKVKELLIKHQEKIIKKTLNRRRNNDRRNEKRPR